jgi:hypothetical protein
MTPAFLSTRQAAVFGAVLIVLLTLPLTLAWMGLPPKVEVYRGMSERAGPFDYMRRQIFESETPLDIAFVGSSLVGTAISVPMLQSRLSAAIGRPAEIRVLRHSWQGPDMSYFLARDLVEHRKVRMLALAIPARIHSSNRPHVQIFRLVRFGDYPGAFDGLGPTHRMAIYAASVLGAPRHALTQLRSNLTDPNAGADHETENTKGYGGRKFVRRDVPAPTLSPESLIYSAAAPGPFRFDGRPLNDYQYHFLKETVELARRHGIFIVLIHLPSPTERGMQTVPDRQRVPSVLGPGVAFVGVPSARLFENTPDETFFDFFEDEHVNTNGGKLFTASIAPAIIQLYEQYAKSN